METKTRPLDAQNLEIISAVHYENSFIKIKPRSNT